MLYSLVRLSQTRCCVYRVEVEIATRVPVNTHCVHVNSGECVLITLECAYRFCPLMTCLTSNAHRFRCARTFPARVQQGAALEGLSYVFIEYCATCLRNEYALRGTGSYAGSRSSSRCVYPTIVLHHTCCKPMWTHKQDLHTAYNEEWCVSSKSACLVGAQLSSTSSLS